MIDISSLIQVLPTEQFQQWIDDLAAGARRLTPPAPGIYAGVPNLIYHAWDAANKSRLDVLAEKSPAHLKWQDEHPREGTDEMAFGSLVHALILEPDAAERDYIVQPDFGDMRSKNSHQLRDAWRAEHADTTPVDEADFKRAMAMRDRVLRHPFCGPFVTGEGLNELSVVWTEPIEVCTAEKGLHVLDVVCKARADMLRAESFDAIGDLKTTRSAAPQDFERSVDEYGYHRQAAWYLDGFARQGLKVGEFIFICTEKDGPMEPAAYYADQTSVDIGRDQNRRLLGVYAQCRASGVWPGYSDGVEKIGLPDWKIRQAFSKSLQGAGSY